MGKTQLCKKKCKHEYKEIDYQLNFFYRNKGKEKRKKKKRNMVFTTLEKKIQYKPLHRNFSKK